MKNKFLIIVALIALIGLVGNVKADCINGITVGNNISQYGITWFFDKEYQCGQFVNGDYWVKTDSRGVVNVTRITPDYFYDGTYYHHGWGVNIDSRLQSFDSRVTVIWPSFYNYSGVSNLPKYISGNASIVKAISREPLNFVSSINGCNNGVNGFGRSCIKTVGVLTVLDSVPPDNGASLFRPSYLGTDFRFKSVDELKLDLLPSLSKTRILNIPDINILTSKYNRLWMDHGWHAASHEYLHSSDYQPGYGMDYGSETAKTALRLMLDDPIQEKMPLLIAYLQLGLDTYSIQQKGIQWPCEGGHGNGRLLPMSFAAVMFNDSAMKNTIMSASLRQYGESSQVIRRDDGVILYGDDEPVQIFGEIKYWCQFSSCVSGKTYADVCGYIDGGTSSGAGTPVADYLSNVDGPWKYTALTQHLMPELKSLWGNRYAFEFIDRYLAQGLWTSPDPAAPLPLGIVPPSGMGTLYGLNSSTETCIGGEGRFISAHGSKLTISSMNDLFMNSIWDNYRTLNGQITYCGDNICNGDETLESCSYDCWNGVECTHYVDKDNVMGLGCNNDGDGASVPWCSLSAAGQKAVAGNVVCVRAGTYAETLTPTNSGTATEKIVFRAYPGDKPLLTQVNIEDLGHIVIDGFNISGTGFQAVYISDSSNILIVGNTIKSSQDHVGINIIPHVDLWNISVIRNNITFSNDGIQVAQNDLYVHNLLIENNHLVFDRQPTEEHPDTLELAGGYDGLVIRNNVIGDGRSANVYLVNQRTTLMKNVFIYGNVIYFTQAGKGIHYDGNGYLNITIHSNTIVGSGYCSPGGTCATVGISGFGDMVPSQRETLTIRNNILYDARLDLYPEYDSDYNIVYRSLRYPSGKAIISGGLGSFLTFNAFKTANPSYETHSIESDPDFVDAFVDGGNYDFRVMGSSKSVNSGDLTGISLPSPFLDIDGTARLQGSAFDIGAYEYQGGETQRPQTLSEMKELLSDYKSSSVDIDDFISGIGYWYSR